MLKHRVLFFLLLLPFWSMAQSTEQKKDAPLKKFIQTFDYRIALQNIGVGMPPNFVNGKLHPGFFIGLQKKINPNSHWDFHMDLGYFAIHSLERAAYVKPGLGYQFALLKGVSLRPNIQLTLMGVGQINDEFQLVNGRYENAPRHRIQLAPGFGLESFIQLAQTKNLNYEALLGYEFAVQLPFSSLSAILPLNQLKVGVRLKK